MIFSCFSFNDYDQVHHGLSEAEFTARWEGNFNARIPCDQLPSVQIQQY